MKFLLTEVVVGLPRLSVFSSSPAPWAVGPIGRLAYLSSYGLSSLIVSQYYVLV